MIPGGTMDCPVSPVIVDCSSRTITFAKDKEATVLATTKLLWSVSESDVTLRSETIGFDPIDSIFVGPSTIGFNAVRSHSLNCTGRKNITSIPDAADVDFTLIQEHPIDVSERKNIHLACARKLVKIEKRFSVLLFTESNVFFSTLDFEHVKIDLRNSKLLDFSQPAD
jgi:hypothetical protein